MERGEKAKKLFMEGYNCAQAVVLAFDDVIDLDRDTAARLASPFGGGMGRLREVCGCVSGMAMVCGALKGYEDPKAGKEKAELYAMIQKAAEKFKEENGSIVCRELLAGITKDANPVPEKRTKEYYRKRPCPELAACAAEILDRCLKELDEEQLRKSCVHIEEKGK